MVRVRPIHQAHLGWILGLLIFIGLLVHVASPVLGTTLLAGWRCEHVPAHSAIEIAGAIIAFVMANLLLTMHRQGEGSSFNIAIAGALSAMGVLDGMHGLVHAGNMCLLLHGLATLIGGVLFALVWLPKRWLDGATVWWLRGVIIIVSVVGAAAMTLPSWVPAAVYNHALEPMAELLSLAGGLLMFSAAVRLGLTFHQTRKVDDLLFCLLCGLFGAEAVMFEQSPLWSFAWWGWHGLRLTAYAAALWFMFASTERTFQSAVRNRRKAENALHETAERTRAILHSTSDGIITFDVHGMIETVNPAVERMFGYAAAELPAVR